MNDPKNDRPDPAPLRMEAVTVTSRTLADGSCVFPVPSRLPPEARLVFGHGSAHDHTHLLDMVLTFPRSEVEAYAAFLARHGAIDREPTAEEVNTVLQLVGNQLVETQIEIMANMSTFLIERLGSGDNAQARETALESIAAQIAAEAAKGGAIPADEATETAEAVAKAIRAWAERLMGEGGESQGKQDGNGGGDNE